jgi:hypothetical protein
VPNVIDTPAMASQELPTQASVNPTYCHRNKAGALRIASIHNGHAVVGDVWIEQLHIPQVNIIPCVRSYFTKYRSCSPICYV